MPWTDEARAKGAARIRERKPWLKSTGPRTDEGKARSARNADKGGWRLKIRGLAKILRTFEDNTPAADSQSTRRDHG